MNMIMEQCEARWHPESNLTNAVTRVQGKGYHPQFTGHLEKNVNKEGRKNDIISKNDLKKKAVERKEKGNAANGLMTKTPKNSAEKNNQSKNNRNHSAAPDENTGKYIKQLKNIQEILNIGMEVAKFLNDGSDDDESNDSFVNQHPSSKKTGKTNAANHRFEGETQGYYEKDGAAKKSNGKKKNAEDGNIQVSVETSEENPNSNRKNIKKKSRKNQYEVSQTLSTANEETPDDFETVQPTMNQKKKKLNTVIKNRKRSTNENDYNVDEVPNRGIGQQDKSVSFRKRAVDNQPKQENLHMHEVIEL